MTVLAGIVTKDKIYIGTDSLWLWEYDFVKEIPGGKFLECPDEDVLIAGCGTEGMNQAFEEMLRSKANRHLLEIESKHDVQTLARALYDHIKELGVGGAKENELPDHESGYLIAVAGIPKIWLIDDDYSVLEFDQYVSTGSGGSYSDIAMWTATEIDCSPLETLKLGLQAACKFSPRCGGEIVIKELDVKENTEVVKDPSV